MLAPHLSAWRECAPFIFISGQLAFDSGGQIVGEDIAGQTLQTLKNVEAVLASAGLVLQDVVKTTVWLRNSSDYAAFNESYASYFGGLKPARSTVTSSPVHPKALVEIEAIAYKMLV
jgi:2-iminobutanoate/2-iminopropanoate deaminase